METLDQLETMLSALQKQYNESIDDEDRHQLQFQMFLIKDRIFLITHGMV